MNKQDIVNQTHYIKELKTLLSKAEFDIGVLKSELQEIQDFYKGTKKEHYVNEIKSLRAQNRELKNQIITLNQKTETL